MDKIGKVIERPFGRSLISFILILTILLGFLPTTAFAAETMTVSDPDALEQIGTITIEGNDYNLYRLVVDTVQYNAIEFRMRQAAQLRLSCQLWVRNQQL